ncbi:MAG: sigma-70 family RNA polymerase sigma factor [Actinomycetes bacterium]
MQGRAPTREAVVGGGTDVDATFESLVEPLRGELTAHCYRMLGAIHDAEDLVQETYLRAWRAFHGFEQRSSVRTWMYKIATNVCLTALESRQRRPLPTGVAQPSGDPTGRLDSRPEVPWLEPLPDRVVWAGEVSDPATEVVGRESVRLAFVAALQHLTPLQRAVLILREVLAWQASEVAAALGVSTAAVNSALQRARGQMNRHMDEGPGRDEAVDPTLGARASQLLEDYVAAFESYDVGRIVSLLTDDVVWEMPPFLSWFRGAEDVGRLISTHCPAEQPGDMRLVATAANGAPVFAVYMRDADGVHRAFQLQHLSLTSAGVGRVTCFFDTTLFPRFGLPMELS